MLTEEQLDNLPEDPKLAFVEGNRMLHLQFANEKGDTFFQTETAYDEFHNGRFDYISYLLGIAKGCGLETVQDWKIPSFTDKEEVFSLYKAMTSTAKSYEAEIRIRNKGTNKKYSVELDLASKVKIRHLIEKIKPIIENAGLEEQKKNSLFNKLNNFLSDVDKNRTPLQNFCLVTLDIASTVGEVAKKLDPVRKLFDSIAGVLGEAKGTEDIILQLPAPYKRIAPPIQEQPVSETTDDEIPF